MKLSEIVAFANHIDLLPNIEAIKLTAVLELLKIKYVLESKDIVPTEQLEELIKNKNSLLQSFDQLDATVSAIKNYVKNIIAQEEISYYEDSYRLYKQSINLNLEHGYAREDDNIPFVDSWGIVRHMSLEVKTDHKNRINNEILSRNLNISRSEKNTIVSRISSYADWHYPAAIIRPGCEDFINYLVANDPLYLIDEHKDLLLPAMNRFNSQYQNRLRPYVINESIGTNIIDRLPDNQFSFFLAYNYFNYKPLDIIKIYLEEIFEKLCPGGTLGMTFNDCDYTGAVSRVENCTGYYTPGRMILEHCAKIGYTEIFKLANNESSTWVELQKPGSLSSLRGGQTLAKINHE
jgi:flagellar biosynthesis/type III secretory pathway chaperone